jgi:CheY-like chemotaxis protein
MAQLFQPFNRLGQETGSVSGTGIGLVVTKQLVELLGGVMGVDSTVGEGSVFWVELLSTPAPKLKNKELEKATPQLPMKPIDAPQKILLYIEDNPANMMLVERLIDRRTDIKLLKAVDGYQGIALARASLPDVILMDINWPGISGIEALKVLQEDVATAHIPVVALSANAMTRDIEVGRQLGFFRYLTKPLVVEEFMTTWIWRSRGRIKIPARPSPQISPKHGTKHDLSLCHPEGQTSHRGRSSRQRSVA